MRDPSSTPARHPYKVLTPQAVRAARPTSITRRIADGGGLYLQTGPSGTRAWVLRTVVKGKRCDVGLGSVALVSLKDARDEAQRLRRIARAGGDPLAERRHARRVVPTFEAVAREVHAEHAKTFKNEKHREQWLSSLQPMFAVFGAKRVDAVESADVLTALNPLWLKRPETARRIKQRVHLIFDWAKAQGYTVGNNPTDGLTKVLPKQPKKRGHHAALPYAQLPAFLQALRDADGSEVVKLALEFTILCATRTSETLGATWSEIDLDSKTWTIPAARMKRGEEHRVPLSSRAVEILERAQTLAGDSSFVFPGRTSQKRLSNMALLMLLRRMKRNDVTVHGFRSSFRDWAAERTSVPREVCEAALAHGVEDKTEAAYRRTDLFGRRRKLMDAWAAFAATKSAEVVPIRA